MKILVIDNDPHALAQVRDFLTCANYLVDTTDDAVAAQDLIRRGHYDVIVMDWCLKGVSSREICKTYRTSGGQGWILFTSEQKEVSALEEAFEVGGDDFLRKPFLLRELAARIGAMLRRKRTQPFYVMSYPSVALEQSVPYAPAPTSTVGYL